MSKRRLMLPAYLEVLKDGEQVFVALETCKQDPEQRGQVLNKALAQLENWRNDYADLFAFFGYRPGERIIKFIDRLRREIGDEWPTLPDEILARDEPKDGKEDA